MSPFRYLLVIRYQRFLLSNLRDADRTALQRYDDAGSKNRDVTTMLGIVSGISLINTLLTCAAESRAAVERTIAELREGGGAPPWVRLPGLDHHPRAAIAYLCLAALYAHQQRPPYALWRAVAQWLLEDVDLNQNDRNDRPVSEKK